MQNLDFGDIMVPFRIKRSHRSKRISLRIGDEGSLLISLPRWASEKKGLNFAREKADWIIGHVSKVRLNRQIRAQKTLSPGAPIRLLGKERCHLAIERTPGKRLKYELGDDRLTVFIPETVTNTRTAVSKCLHRFYLDTAREYLEWKTAFFAAKLTVEFGQIRLKRNKTRWGSCSIKGNLNFNYLIILAPSEVIDYLIVHELCHLKQMNHSPEFWQLVGSVLPDYSRARRWLTKNSAAVQCELL